MASINLNLSDIDGELVRVHTDADRPQVGRCVTPAQALAMELLGTSFKRGADVVYCTDHSPTIAFLRDLITPEGYGLAVTAEIRARARELLQRVDVHPRKGPVAP